METKEITKSGEFMRAASSLLITLCPPPDALDEANISEGLISRPPIKQEMVLLVASGWVEIVKQLPCWWLTAFSLIGHWDYGNYGYPCTAWKILLRAHYLLY